MNQTIYEKAKSLCGEYITGPVSDEVIEKAEEIVEEIQEQDKKA